jgi:hypothetical protein
MERARALTLNEESRQQILFLNRNCIFAMGQQNFWAWANKLCGRAAA